MKIKNLLAIVLYKLGFPPKVSIDIADSMVFGYGEFSSIGVPEYEVEYPYLSKKDRELARRLWHKTEYSGLLGEELLK